MPCSIYKNETPRIYLPLPLYSKFNESFVLVLTKGSILFTWTKIYLPFLGLFFAPSSSAAERFKTFGCSTSALTIDCVAKAT